MNITNNKNLPEKSDKNISKKEKSLSQDERFIVNAHLRNKTIDATNNVVIAASKISSNLVESERIRSDTKTKLESIKSEHIKDMTIIHEKFDHQNRMLNNAEMVIDKGLEDNDIDKIALGLSAGANIANTNPVQEIQSKIDQAFDNDNDEFIEI